MGGREIQKPWTAIGVCTILSGTSSIAFRIAAWTEPPAFDENVIGTPLATSEAISQRAKNGSEKPYYSLSAYREATGGRITS